MDHLNIHYVTDRGFAKRNKIVAIDDWQKLCANIETMETDIMVRLEKTFVPLNVNVKCAVNSKNNLIVDPKGNIYGCTMFMNFNNMQSGTWLKDGIRMNEDLSNENHICSSVKNGCPALPLFNQELSENAKMNNLKVDCIFNKTNILNV
jgi:radical SAM protein with 4Fe4S-binding SPASM domain